MVGSQTATPTKSFRGAGPATTTFRRPSHPGAGNSSEALRAIDILISALMVLAIITIFTVSAAMLTDWKVHYLSTGGNVLEKFHPATYFALLAFFLLIFRDADPIGEINRMFSEARLLLVYLASWLCLLIQMLVLERPFTVIVDTFLLPVLLCLVIWRLSPALRKPMVWAIHFTILLNVVIGYYEYLTGHRLFALALGGNVTVLGEWRASALLGHPLTASGVIAAYVLALILRPALCPPVIVRLPLIAFCLGSLMAFGGRTALVTVLTLIGALAAIETFRILRGGRTSLPVAIGAICLLFVAAAGIFTALDLGIFDKMLLRFSSDKGSTLARYATFSLLSHFDWRELILGPNPVRANALQTQWGLRYGVEDFWVSCIVQFGIIHTVLLTIGLVGLFTEILRRASSAAWAIVLLIVIVAASSVSFSSKNIQLAQFVLLIALLLPREQRRAAAADPGSRSRRRLVPAIP
jgi:hypothetical protein